MVKKLTMVLSIDYLCYKDLTLEIQLLILRLDEKEDDLLERYINRNELDMLVHEGLDLHLERRVELLLVLDQIETSL